MTTTKDDPERIEPFATILDLLAEHGIAEIVQAISDEEGIISDEEEVCASCQKIARRWHLELELLLSRMEDYEIANAHEDEPEDATGLN